MPEVKLSPKPPNPKSSDKDGLRVIAEALIKRPNDCHLVIAMVNADETATKHREGGRVVKVGIEHIEVVHPDDVELAESILLRAHKARVGQAPLPLPGLESTPE